ncbi:MAG TPA: TerC family protein [Burkholderiales bacterium]|nr:TerC family protein [Burkholderiales bacterium]
MEEFLTAQFWLGLGTIVWVNVILSGDNAVVIALAARSLPDRQRRLAVLWGAGAAVVLRIVLTVVAVKLLELPYLKLIGAVLLLWIAVQLLVPEDESADIDARASSHLFGAIKTILIADLVMSVDNVLAVAAAAKGSFPLLVIGLAISIPLVVFGATMLMGLMERFPVIVTLGAAILGWTGGEMGVTDPAIAHWVKAHMEWIHTFEVVPSVGAVAVVVIGKWLAGRRPRPGSERP